MEPRRASVGTNYYYYPGGERACPYCQQEAPRLHIGKSSVGWNFSLRIYPERGIVGLEDWKEIWSRPPGAIFDEHGRPVTVEEMLPRITERQRPEGLLSMCSPENRSPFVRPLDVRPGDGTYDLCNYEFS
jgi:hypothetical protein